MLVQIQDEVCGASTISPSSILASICCVATDICQACISSFQCQFWFGSLWGRGVVQVPNLFTGINFAHHQEARQVCSLLWSCFVQNSVRNFHSADRTPLSFILDTTDIPTVRSWGDAADSARQSTFRFTRQPRAEFAYGSDPTLH